MTKMQRLQIQQYISIFVSVFSLVPINFLNFMTICDLIFLKNFKIPKSYHFNLESLKSINQN